MIEDYEGNFLSLVHGEKLSFHDFIDHDTLIYVDNGTVNIHNLSRNAAQSVCKTNISTTGLLIEIPLHAIGHRNVAQGRKMSRRSAGLGLPVSGLQCHDEPTAAMQHCGTTVH